MAVIDKEKRPYKICGITTRAMTLKSFMIEPMKFLCENGFACYAICQQDGSINEQEVKPVVYLPMEMQSGAVSPLEIIKVTWKLFKLFRKERFDIVQYASSNAGLYAALASWMARVPIRVFCQWGVIYTDYTGIKKFFYKSIEKITCWLSTSVQPDSPTNLEFALSEGLYRRGKGYVIYNGSATGVDLNKFNRNKREEWRNEVLSNLSIPKDAYVFGFVGRQCPEKGVNELYEAFLSIASRNDNVYLIVVGPVETPNRLKKELYDTVQTHPRIKLVGRVAETSVYYASFDMLILPSYREGFGMVLLEAAATGTPSIISNIIGPTDLIKDRYNGFVCEVRSTQSLEDKMNEALSLSPIKKCEIENNAYQVAAMKYNVVDFNRHLLANRLSLIEKK